MDQAVPPVAETPSADDAVEGQTADTPAASGPVTDEKVRRMHFCLFISPGSRADGCPARAGRRGTAGRVRTGRRVPSIPELVSADAVHGPDAADPTDAVGIDDGVARGGRVAGAAHAWRRLSRDAAGSRRVDDDGGSGGGDVPAVDGDRRRADRVLDWVAVAVDAVAGGLCVRGEGPGRRAGCERGLAGDTTVVGGEVHCGRVGFSGRAGAETVIACMVSYFTTVANSSCV